MAIADRPNDPMNLAASNDIDRSNDRTGAAALADKYDTIAYAARSHAVSHPDHLATLATLFGLTPPPVANCRVLEFGCNDGANLLPIAAALPAGEFVGCDVSARAVDAARRAVAELGLTNVTLLQQDLRELPAELGAFDYMIAHGIYSWVPAPVRDALLRLASQRLAPNGVLFVSYNVYPGCHVRQAAWEMLHFHVDSIADPRARLDAARALSNILAEPGPTQNEIDAMLRNELKRLAQQSDSALFHDDLAEPNEPLYFHEFVAHAERHGLKFLAEAKLSMMASAGLSPRVQQLLAGLDRLKREQYLDFARMRRFRQSLLCRGESATGFTLARERIATMHASATTPLLRAAVDGKTFGAEGSGDTATARAMLQWLVEIAPRAAAVDEIKAWLANRAAGGSNMASGSVEALLADACFAGAVQLHVHPPALAIAASERPIANLIVRWQAARQEHVTNLRHETMTLKDPTARTLLAMLDGSRTRAQLAGTVNVGESDAFAAEHRVDEYVRQFAKHGLLIG